MRRVIFISLIALFLLSLIFIGCSSGTSELETKIAELESENEILWELLTDIARIHGGMLAHQDTIMELASDPDLANDVWLEDFLTSIKNLSDSVTELGDAIYSNKLEQLEE